MKNLLFDLCSANGVSGEEGSVAKIAKLIMGTYANVECDVNGNVIAEFGKLDAKYSIMLDAHIDQIGLIITHIDSNGFVKASPCGGIDRRILQAEKFLILADKPIPCICCSTPPHLSSGNDEKAVSADNLWFDTGISGDKLKDIVSLGDRIVFDGHPRELLNNRVTSKALDNRAGVAAVMYCGDLLKKQDLNCKVIISLSTREEVNMLGARTAAFSCYPSEAVAVDVSFAKQSGVPSEKSGNIDEGPMIGIAPVLDKEISEKLITAAKVKKMKYQCEVMGGATGTNADVISSTRGGIRTGLVSIPLRSMHTGAEIVSLNDIAAVGELLAEYVLERSIAVC
ncbi:MULTISPECIES: M42 family peptidase [unclassified Ruminococcus]|uniref:M42 family peptidase n=1 Tax=unclassified Ruminococcus TaxID=2608920 RepID=UPI00210BAD49|nr:MULTISPECIES: M42 family peptidase [unclassified Ruminococcus]MCQ4022044.1 M42 family peptidase [Ruminococcus sp. zg-924]MCQ4114364.1 M42 family peptidase [Ruminococcus sp. zg-921]